MEKLLAITNIAERAFGIWLFQRLLPNVLIIVGLTMITSIMIAAIIITSMFCAYQLLLNNGFEIHSAIMLIGSLALLITIIFAICIIAHLQQLRRMPQKLLQEKLASAPKIGTLVSFIKGFMAK